MIAAAELTREQEEAERQQQEAAGDQGNDQADAKSQSKKSVPAAARRMTTIVPDAAPTGAAGVQLLQDIQERVGDRRGTAVV